MNEYRLTPSPSSFVDFRVFLPHLFPSNQTHRASMLINCEVISLTPLIAGEKKNNSKKKDKNYPQFGFLSRPLTLVNVVSL
jgi:hypothetical protein